MAVLTVREEEGKSCIPSQSSEALEGGEGPWYSWVPSVDEGSEGRLERGVVPVATEPSILP